MTCKCNILKYLIFEHVSYEDYTQNIWPKMICSIKNLFFFYYSNASERSNIPAAESIQFRKAQSGSTTVWRSGPGLFNMAPIQQPNVPRWTHSSAKVLQKHDETQQCGPTSLPTRWAGWVENALCQCGRTATNGGNKVRTGRKRWQWCRAVPQRIRHVTTIYIIFSNLHT